MPERKRVIPNDYALMIMAKYLFEIRNIGTYLILLLEQELLLIMFGKSLATEDDIEYYFDLCLRSLSFIGLECSMNANYRHKKSKFLQKLPIYLTNLQGVICLITQIYSIVDAIPGDASYATKVTCQLISNVQCISKGFRMASMVDGIQEVFEQIAIVWKKYKPEGEIKRVILDRAHKTLFFCKCYVFILVGCVMSYDIPPLINLLLQYKARESTNHTYDYSQRILLLTYPYKVEDAKMYSLMFFQEGYLLFASAVYWVTCDTLFAQTTAHICLQFQILKYDIDALIDNEDNEKQLKRNIVILIRRHRELLNICDLIEDIFSPVILSTMLLSALNICVNTFEVRETISKKHYDETGIYVLLFMITFFQIIFYCIFAERLTEQTTSFANSIYNCKWTNKDYKFRFYIQLIILKCQRPFYCTAYGFFPIGNKQLSSVMSTSFSYYMMLQTMR